MPIVGVIFCLYLMASLPGVTWLRFFVWMAAGLMVYFSYGRFHSRLGFEISAETVDGANMENAAREGERGTSG